LTVSIKEAARRYTTALGWSIVPIPPGIKGPNGSGWNKPEKLIKTPDECDRIRDGWNIGVQLEESGIVSIDIDHIEYTKIMLESLGLKYDELFDGAPRITGRPDRDKALFRAPPGIKLTRHTLTWPKQDENSKPVTVIEFRGGPNQDVLPPSIHPDTGKPYTWRHPPDTIPDLPAPLLAIMTQWDTFLPRMKNACPWDTKVFKPPTKKPRKTKPAETGVIQQFNDRVKVEDILRKHGYKQVARQRWLSPYSETGIPGVIVFDDGRVFSHHGSDPWADSGHSLDAFDLFCQMEHGGNMGAALDGAKRELNIPTFDELAAEGAIIADAIIKTEKQKKYKTPPDLLQIPGILQEVVDYYNETARKPQPQFAVSTALALGSVVMGRRYITCQENYSSIYIANVGLTGSGKEHAKHVIETFLEAAGVADHLLGPPGYTSSGGVLSSLYNLPCHVAIIDELGNTLESARKSNNSNKLDAHTMIMEAFGRLHGTLRPPGYSTMTLSEKQKMDLERRSILHPALTILGMTTPDTLYNTLTHGSVTSGFIPRFVIVESEYGRPKTRRLGKRPVISTESIDWIKTCYQAHEDDGNLSEGFGPDTPPSPILIPFEPEALDLMDDFEDELAKRMDKHETIGLAGLLNRTREIAQRIALIVAVSSGHQCIYTEDAEWAIKFMRHYSIQTETKMQYRLAGSDFEHVCKEVVEYIKTAGATGATEYEVRRACNKYRACEPRIREAVFQVIPEDYDIEFVTITQSGRGRPRMAYVAK